MAGTALDEFTTLMASQGPAWASGAEEIINEGVKNTYTWPRISMGKSMMEMVQGGDEIQDTIFFDVKSTFQRYNPNAEFDYENPQTGTTWTVKWAFATAHLSWTKHEVGLNKDTTTRRYRAQRYKSVMFQKHQNLWTDVCNEVDSEFWAAPNDQTMEIASPSEPRVPYSIPVFINETSDAQSTTTDGLPSVGWGSTTTVMNIAPGTKQKWQNQRELYTFTSASALGAATIFPAMTKLFFKTKFDRLPKRPEYSDKTTSPHVILCSLQGLTNYEFALRANQDEFRGIGMTSGQDPSYHLPTFRNIPLDYIAELDTAAIYPTSASEGASTELDTSNATNTGGVGFAGPRYYFINGEYLVLAVHSENYAVLTDPITPSKQPFTRVQVMDMWNNFYARSRQRQGMLAPSADTTDA